MTRSCPQRRSRGPGPARGPASGGAWLSASRRYRWNEPGRVTSVRRGCPAMASLAGGPVVTAFGSDSEVPGPSSQRNLGIDLTSSALGLSSLSCPPAWSGVRTAVATANRANLAQSGTPARGPGRGTERVPVDGQWGTLRCRRSLAAAHAILSEPSMGPAASWCAAGRLLAISASVRGPAQLMTRTRRRTFCDWDSTVMQLRVGAPLKVSPSASGQRARAGPAPRCPRS
jgi:hypothetical protein